VEGWAVKIIQLSRGLVSLVDDEDHEDLSQFNWFATNLGYAARNMPRGESPRNELMHRRICGVEYGQYVDHINYNTLDNRRPNLRVCTNSQNNMSRLLSSNSTSGYKGVSWSLVANRWRSYIKINGRQIHLGYCDTKEEGALLYNKAALKHFKEFAILNEVSP
jgi:hypothetical protein